MSRDPGDGEGQGDGKRRRTRRPRPSPSQLSPEEASDKAFAVGLRLLSHRERSRAELKIVLRRKGYGADTIAGVLDRLEESGLQSDARFAEVFTQEAHRGRGLSTSAVQGELRRRRSSGSSRRRAPGDTPERDAAGRASSPAGGLPGPAGVPGRPLPPDRRRGDRRRPHPLTLESTKPYHGRAWLRRAIPEEFERTHLIPERTEDTRR
ncbi:MAG: regulatory protein RecX [Actinobacteria bacterium]|nr:MAG: regulatory protein RecX [Actinomycetota bacterium]